MKIIVSIVILLVLNGGEYTSSLQLNSYAEVEIKKNPTLNGDFTSYPGLSKARCAWICETISTCMSFAFDKAADQCDVYKNPPWVSYTSGTTTKKLFIKKYKGDTIIIVKGENSVNPLTACQDIGGTELYYAGSFAEMLPLFNQQVSVSGWIFTGLKKKTKSTYSYRDGTIPSSQVSYCCGQPHHNSGEICMMMEPQGEGDVFCKFKNGVQYAFCYF